MTLRRVGATVALTLAPLAACTDSVGSQPGTSTSIVDESAPTTARPWIGDWHGATVTPNVVAAGDRFELTPIEPVEPTCGVTVRFYTAVPYGQGELIGAVLLGDVWAPHDASVTSTLLPCDPPSVSAPVSARVPAELAAGLSLACIDDVTEGAGCSLLRVVVPGEIDDDATIATADPAVVAPGQTFIVTPALVDTVVCSRHELLVGVGGALDLVGFPTADGLVGLPVPGATTTVPRCGPVAGIATEPVEYVTPDLPDGAYAICLAFRTQADGCARIEVVHR